MKLILVSTFDHQRNLMNELGVNNNLDDDVHVIHVEGRVYERYDEIEDRTLPPRTPSEHARLDRWRSAIYTRLNEGGRWVEAQSHSPP